METDIVKRLTINAQWLHRDGFDTSANNAIDAKAEILSLRQRVQELEKDCDEYHQVAMNHIHANEKLTAERDKAHQYWQTAEGRCDALMEQRNELLAALQSARNRIADMLLADDGQAWKEAQKSLHRIDNVIASVKEKA